MHDLRAIRQDPAGFDRDLGRRGHPPRADAILALDAERRAALTAAQEAQARRNALSKQVGQGRRAGADTSALEAEAAALRDSMAAL
jgi:seryl-tRNA synthetase